MSAPDLPAFDPGIIERYVENTYRKATAIFIGSVTAGVMIGAMFGATPLTSLGDSWPIPKMFGFATMLLGAIVGGVIGYIVGDTRAFLCRLQAQTALCQVQTERNTAATLKTLHAIASARRDRPAAAPPAAAPAPPAASPATAVEPLQPEPQPQPPLQPLRIAATGGDVAAPPVTPPLST